MVDLRSEKITHAFFGGIVYHVCSFLLSILFSWDRFICWILRVCSFLQYIICNDANEKGRPGLLIERFWLSVDGRVRSLFKYGVAALAASLFTVFQIGGLSPSTSLIIVGEACAIIGGVLGYFASLDNVEDSE